MTDRDGTVSFLPGGLSDLAKRRNARSRRESSYDRTGGNDDWCAVESGQTLKMAEIDGPGCIRHIWITGGGNEPYFLKKTVLRMYWDGETDPSVEVPLGDFFGAMHGLAHSYVSLPLSVVGRGMRMGLNTYFPMPFDKRAKVELVNECEKSPLTIYYHVDYELYDDHLSPDLLRFHAGWHRETCKATSDRVNLTGDENYVVLDARGRGHYVGCMLGVKSLQPDWWGEGDDMIFVDGEKWPPSLHGTGTEDYFLSAYGFPVRFEGPYHGVLQTGDTYDWTGRWIVYRFHIEDPVVFRRSIRVTIEHGHANDRGDDWTSVAYWYQDEPHRESEKLPKPADRLPLP
jgi:hypothetical protein